MKKALVIGIMSSSFLLIGCFKGDIDPEVKQDVTVNPISREPSEFVLSDDAPTDLSEIYNTYCAKKITINTKTGAKGNGNDNKAENLKLAQNFSSMDIETLKKNLLENIYGDKESELSFALYYIGFKLTQASNIDDGFSFYECAAKKYYNRYAMYKLMTLYNSGTDAMLTLLPNALVKNKIEINYSKVYYWVSAIMYAELGENTGFTDASTKTGWNTIALLDTLQNTDKITDSEMTIQETLAKKFIENKYPEVLKAKGL